ncbi:MAG: type II toxin-antitoxin system PemK/MazF family toxin [Candidatus Limnocylindrales bacterium]
MVVSQGDVWWKELPDPAGAEPGFRRPVVVVQGDSLNRSRISTIVCVVVTSNLKWASAPGNVRLAARESGLPRDGLVNVSQIVTLDRSRLTDHVGRLAPVRLETILAGIDIILGH